MLHVTASSLRVQFLRTMVWRISVTGISNELAVFCLLLWGAGNIPQPQQHRQGMTRTGSHHASLDYSSRQNLPVPDQPCTCFLGFVVTSQTSGAEHGNSLTGTCLQMLLLAGMSPQMLPTFTFQMSDFQTYWAGKGEMKSGCLTGLWYL